MRITADEKQLREVYLIAKRLGTIEAQIWKQQPERKHLNPDHTKIPKMQVEAVQRKLDEAILSTQGENGHRTFPGGKWLRCYDCTGIAHAGNLSY